MHLQSLIFSNVFANAPDSPPLVPDNELVHDDINDIGPLSSIPELDESARLRIFMIIENILIIVIILIKW